MKERGASLPGGSELIGQPIEAAWPLRLWCERENDQVWLPASMGGFTLTASLTPTYSYLLLLIQHTNLLGRKQLLCPLRIHKMERRSNT